MKYFWICCSVKTESQCVAQSALWRYAKCPLRLSHQPVAPLGSDGVSLQEAGPCGRKGGHWHVLLKGALGPAPSSVLLLSHELSAFAPYTLSIIMFCFIMGSDGRAKWPPAENSGPYVKNQFPSTKEISFLLIVWGALLQSWNNV